jgi:hypothetical protein
VHKKKFFITLRKESNVATKKQSKSTAAVTDAAERIFVESPVMPVKEFIQEALDLYAWSKSDNATLTGVDVTAKDIEGLHTNALKLRVEESKWRLACRSRTAAERQWKEASPGAYELRDRLVHDFLYGFRGKPDVLAMVRETAKDTGNADMIQDLMNLKTIGTDKREALERINFDFALLEKAGTVAEEMGTLLAAANAAKASEDESKAARDLAYTCLKQLMTRVRECGQYLFYRNDKRRQGYSSSYHRKCNSNSAKEKAKAAAPEPLSKVA